jgi:peptidoglycan hydrolase-like protein with peptidoglycan-binding domain
VGTVDGLMGGRTQDAILAARKANGLPLSDKIDAAFLAALSTMPARPVSAERATADTSTVRRDAPGLLDGLGGIRIAAGTLFGGSLLGGAQDTGLLDTIKGTAEQATDTMQSVQSVVASGVGAVQWIANHWWIFGLLLGIWLLAKVGLYVLKVVTLYRTGRLL